MYRAGPLDYNFDTDALHCNEPDPTPSAALGPRLWAERADGLTLRRWHGSQALLTLVDMALLQCPVRYGCQAECPLNEAVHPATL